MEGTSWMRIGAIFALLLGSLYVLLPTFLQEDLETRLARKASEVEVPTADRVDLDLEIEVPQGDPAAVAQILQQRFAVAGVPVERVTPGEGEVTVVLAPGGDRARVEELAMFPGHTTLLAPSALAAAPAPEGAQLPAAVSDALSAGGVDPSAWAGPLTAASEGAIPAEAAVPADLTGVSATPEGALLVQGPALPDGWPFAVVLLDGAPEGVIVPVEGGFQYAALVETTRDELAAIVTPAVPPGLAIRPEAPAEPVAAQEAAPVAEEGGPPAWLVGILPDTRMNLGLDLQGGLDLTLQVGLEEAVLGQASRDLAYVRDLAEREGVKLESARRDRAEPTLWLESQVPLADLQAFVRKAAPDYVYSESEGNRHAFTMRDDRVTEVQDSAVDQVLETLRKRVDATGVKEPSIAKKGGGRINVQLPGEVDLQAAVDALGTTAVLEFRMVDMEFDPSVLEQIIVAAQQQMPAEQYADDMLLNDWLWTTGRLPEDRLILWEYLANAEGKSERTIPYVVKNEVVLTGNDVNNAGVSWDENQQAYVSLDFKPRGGRVFCDVTSANVGKQFAIILDQEVQSAPSIRERICGGSARIDMGGAEDPMREAQTLALVLRTGSLDAPVDIGGVRQVGATLGQEAIRSGTMAAVIGGLLVVTFMLVWYRTAGLVANLALLMNVLLVLASLAVFGATLTLPGIAGIALTVGMAVDANIIIYERIREELKLGINPRKAVDVGFEKALMAILDSNITTAIAGVVLFSYGTGPIKGFAVTLLIGIATTLITALFVTRTLMDLLTRSSATRLRI